MRRVVIGVLLGVALACGTHRKDCEDFACDDCRMCATDSVYGCRDLFVACERDPSCLGLDQCIFDCSDLVGQPGVACERECRYAHPQGEMLYDDRFACLDEVCARTCQ
jgi:hypothetical protein